MRWKAFVFLTFLAFYLSICTLKAQSIFDPFGLRNRNKNKGHSMTESSSSEESSKEHDRRGFPFSFFDPFGVGRDSSSRERNGRRRGQSSDEVTTTTTTAPRSPSNDPFFYPESRAGPSPKKPTESSEQYYSICGPNNRLCNEDYIRELGLRWRPQVHNGTGIFMRDPNAPGGKRFEPVGIEMPNEKYGYCWTPKDERGYCRHLEHCIQDEFRSDFITFLQYKCDIPNQNWVGVCCPDPDLEAVGRSARVTTTTQRARSYPQFPPPPFGFPPPPFSRQTTTVRTTPPSYRRTRSTRRSSQQQQRSFIGSENCGITGNGTQLRQMPRIVGGRIARPDEWPWMVALLKKSEAVDYRAGQYCGGVLISEFHVLSAGHCVDGFAKENLAARIGEYDFSKDTEGITQDIDLAEVFVHENYNRYTYENDIAILKLAKSAYFDPRIKSICLPREDDDNSVLVNQNAFVAGFGTIYYGGPASDVLMEITVPIWSQEECQESYPQPIQETNLCAGARAGSKDSCQGDSGGPLQLLLRGRFTVVGIVSWGIKCSEPGYPGVYTRVSKYLRWIARQMRK